MATKLSTFLATPDTGTAASHYYVETASDNFIRPKTLANVQTEIVTTAVLGTGTANSSYFLRGDRTWSNNLAGPALGTTLGSQSKILTLSTNNGNAESLELTSTREIAGVSWNGSGIRLQEKIDATWMGYIQFNGGQTVDNSGGISFGTGTTTTSAVTIPERMRIDANGLITQLNATSGRGAMVGEQTFRLPSNLTAIGPTIADFFGATSSISLEASSVYEIRAYCMFNKTTAGTATWNLTYSSAPTFIIASYVASPITGIGAGTPTSGFAANAGVTTTPFPATGSLSTGVAHAFQFTIQVITNLATNFRFQLTQSLGTAIPVSNSYYTVKKIAASTGTFV